VINNSLSLISILPSPRICCSSLMAWLNPAHGVRREARQLALTWNAGRSLAPFTCWGGGLWILFQCRMPCSPVCRVLNHGLGNEVFEQEEDDANHCGKETVLQNSDDQGTLQLITSGLLPSTPSQVS
jgi:hypothetical protein